MAGERTYHRANRGALALIVGFVLLVWGVWLTGIDRFPPFVDETVHIHASERILQNGSPLEGVNLGRQFTIWWYTAFQPASQSPLWVARTATVLAFLPGLAAGLALAHRIAGRWAILFSGLLMLFSTYHFFFARLALADTVAASAILIAVCFAFKLQQTTRLRYAALAGVCLFLAAGAKINTLPFLGVPVAAALVFGWGSTWRRALRWLVVCLGAAMGLLGVFVVVLRLRGLDFLSNSLALAMNARGTSEAAAFDLPRIAANAQTTVETLAGYTGDVVLVLLLIALPLLLVFPKFRRPAVYLLLCLLGPALVYWINIPQETRFYVAPVALLLLAGGITLAVIYSDYPIVLRWIAVAAVILWGMAQWLPFAQTLTSDPAHAPLPPIDYAQYVTSDASGFGFDEVEDVLAERSVTRVIGILANCQGLRYRLPASTPIECPPVRPDGQDIAALETLMESSRADGVVVVLEALPYAPATSPGTVVTTIEAVPGRPTLTVYDLSPQP